MRWAQEVLRVLLPAIRQELRVCGMLHEPDPYLPPPCDLDREGEILSALVNGHVAASDLAPLAPKHFFADINRAIFCAAVDCTPGDLDGMLLALGTRGWRGAMLEEIRNIAFHQPFCSLDRLRGHVRVLVELTARRALIVEMRKVEVELRRGEITAAEARRRLVHVEAVAGREKAA